MQKYDRPIRSLALSIYLTLNADFAPSKGKNTDHDLRIG